MSRPQARDVVIDNTGTPVGSVTVSVFDVGTTNPVSDTIYSGESGSATLANPFTSAVNGEVEFYLDKAKLVTVRYTKTGYTTRDVNLPVIPTLIGSPDLLIDGKTRNTSIPTVASAAALTLPDTGDMIIVSGTTSITSIVATNNTGRRVHLHFEGVLTVTDGSNLKLAGNFVTATGSMLTLFCDGTNWHELGRSANGA